MSAVDNTLSKRKNVAEENELMTNPPKKSKQEDLCVYKLKKKIIENLTCPVCVKIATPPIKQCSNGHPICCGCWQKCPLCPICREKKKDIRSLAWEQMGIGVFVDCEYKKDGCCDENILYENLEEHYASCSYHRVQCCPIDGCEEMILINKEGELQKHIENVHKVAEKDDCGDEIVVLNKGMRLGKTNTTKSNKMGWSLVGYKQKMFIVLSKQINDLFSVTVTGLGKKNGFGRFFAEMTMKDKNNKIYTWKEEITTSEERYYAKMKKESCSSYLNINTKDIIDNFAKKNRISLNDDDTHVEIKFDITITSI